MMDRDEDSAGVKFPPPFAFAGGLLAGLAVNKMLGDPGLPLPHSLSNLLGWLAIVLGAGTMLSAASLFRNLGTNVKPWKTATALATDGVFRWTRNPMYLGMAGIHVGIALVCDSLFALLAVAPVVLVIQREVIAREEAYLEAKFGERYRAYKAGVRRWI